MNEPMQNSSPMAGGNPGMSEERAARRKFYSRMSGWGMLLVVAIILTVIIVILDAIGKVPPPIQPYIPRIPRVLNQDTGTEELENASDEVNAIEKDLDDTSTNNLDTELGDIEKELGQ